MPISIAHFTDKGEQNKVKANAKHRRLSGLNMSEATRHFHRLTDQKEANSVAEKTH